MTPLIRDAWRRLMQTAGAVSIEFLIILPAFLLLLALIGFASLFIATQSEVQQVAFELARKAFVLVGQGYDGDICQKLGADYLPGLVGNSLSLEISKVSPVAPCPGAPDASGLVTVSVTYDMAGGGAAQFSSMLGFDLGRITRAASVYVE